MSDFNIPGAAGGPVKPVDAFADVIDGIPSVATWLDADEGWFDIESGKVTGWIDRVGLNRWVPKFPADPVTLNPTGLGGKPAIMFGSASTRNGQMVAPAGVETYPAGKDYTIAFAFSCSMTTGNGSFVASGGPATASNARISINAATGAVSMAHAGVNIVSASGAWTGGVVHWVIGSYDFSGKLAVIYMDGVQRGQSDTVTTEVANDPTNVRMVLGADGATGSVGNHLLNSAMSCPIVLPGLAAHKPENAPILAALQARRAFFGIA